MTYISDLQFYNPLYDGYDTAVDQNLNKNDFLNLLVTQLRNQNPLEPMKDQEFIAQLAQFSQLEQLENMNSSLAISTQVSYLMSQTIANTMATTLIGKTVVAEGADFFLTADEDINISFNLAAEAASVEIKIFNDSGTLVRTIQLDDLPKGNNTCSWDGRNDEGSLLGSGDYSYEVTARTLSGESLIVNKRVIGVINSVKYIDGKAYLIVGGYKVDLSTIIEVEQAGGTASYYSN